MRESGSSDFVTVYLMLVVTTGMLVVTTGILVEVDEEDPSTFEEEGAVVVVVVGVFLIALISSGIVLPDPVFVTV